MGIAVTAIGGLMIGSFLNVVAHRLPRHESLVTPGSRCPSCATPIKPYDNVPVLGWLLLGGRCRSCGESISPRYPIVEALTALLAVAVVLVEHSPRDVALGLILVAVLTSVALIDLDERIIPNSITLPAAVVAIVVGGAMAPSKLPEQLIAGASAAAFLLVFVLAYPRGMGMGDVKLAGVLGLYLGRAAAPALLVGVIAATIFGALVIARLGVQQGRKTALPFGPFLALGGVVGLLAGPAIVHWYVHSVL
jgi:leader peptidase (prepilin peptidase)/N-methyltransferase